MRGSMSPRRSSKDLMQVALRSDEGRLAGASAVGVMEVGFAGHAMTLDLFDQFAQGKDRGRIDVVALDGDLDCQHFRHCSLHSRQPEFLGVDPGETPR